MLRNINVLLLAAVVAGASAADAKSMSETLDICKEGASQSPVNLHGCPKEIDGETYNIPLEREKLELGWGANEATLEKVCYAGNECNLHITPTGRPKGQFSVKDHGATATYHLTHCVVQMPSEHQLNHMQYPMEVQCHHTRDGTDNRRKGIISTLYENGVSEENGETYSPFIGQIQDRVPGKAGEKVTLRAFSFNPTGTAGRTRYHTYSGSQTAGDCKEDVDWFIMYDQTGIGKAQLEKLTKAFEANNTLWKKPRPLQHLYGRHPAGCPHHHDAAPAFGCLMSLALVAFSLFARA